jgi:hypothetical protein
MTHAGLRLTSELALDASGVLVVRHGLTNLKAQPWQVDRFAVTLPVAERAGGDGFPRALDPRVSAAPREA